MGTDIARPALTGFSGTLENSAVLRFFIVLALYAGQGVTQGLVLFAVPAWMAANGVGVAEIALAVGTMTAPWSFKFLAGFVIDRFAFLPMGRRKGWIALAQIVAIAGLLMLAFVDPLPDQVLLITVLLTIANGAVALQDVAIDALTVDIFPESQREIAGGIAGSGQIIGVAAMTAIGGIAFAAGGAFVAFLVASVLLGVILASLIVVRERSGERLLPWSAGEAHPENVARSASRFGDVVVTVLRSTFSKPALQYMPVLIARGMSYGAFLIFIPILATQFVGWDEAELGALNGTAQITAAILCLTIGSWLAGKVGAQRWLLICNALLLALVAGLLAFAQWWASATLLTIVVFGWLTLKTLTVIGVTVINMRLSPPRAAATQFALFMGMNNVGISVAGFMIGSIAYLAEPAGMLWLMAGVLALAVAVLAMVRYPVVQIEDPPLQRDALAG